MSTQITLSPEQSTRRRGRRRLSAALLAILGVIGASLIGGAPATAAGTDPTVENHKCAAMSICTYNTKADFDAGNVNPIETRAYNYGNNPATLVGGPTSDNVFVVSAAKLSQGRYVFNNTDREVALITRIEYGHPPNKCRAIVSAAPVVAPGGGHEYVNPNPEVDATVEFGFDSVELLIDFTVDSVGPVSAPATISGIIQTDLAGVGITLNPVEKTSLTAAATLGVLLGSPMPVINNLNTLAGAELPTEIQVATFTGFGRVSDRGVFVANTSSKTFSSGNSDANLGNGEVGNGKYAQLCSDLASNPK